MKCPYKNFEECLVEKCPSCTYEEVKETVMAGRRPYHMSEEEAIECGSRWEQTKTIYKFKSCSLASANVQPVLRDETIINNTTKINVDNSSYRSIF